MSDKPDNTDSRTDGISNTNKSRRKVLKKAGVAGGAAAVAAWTKPSLNSVVLPAHAQTTGPLTLGGITSEPPIAANPSFRNQSIAGRALEVLIPQARAGVAPFDENCEAFTINGTDNYSHCITLTFDEAVPNTGFSLTLTGPDVYYNYCYTYYYYYAFYEGVVNFGGSVNGTLVGQDFEVSLGDLDINGTVAEDFQTASGVVIQTAGGFRRLGHDATGTEGFCDNGYGAYWSATLDGASCSPGSGASGADGRTIVVDPLCNE